MSYSKHGFAHITRVMGATLMIIFLASSLVSPNLYVLSLYLRGSRQGVLSQHYILRVFSCIQFKICIPFLCLINQKYCFVDFCIYSIFSLHMGFLIKHIFGIAQDRQISLIKSSAKYLSDFQRYCYFRTSSKFKKKHIDFWQL